MYTQLKKFIGVIVSHCFILAAARVRATCPLADLGREAPQLLAGREKDLEALVAPVQEAQRFLEQPSRP
jgi:hypothetical protein